jgi:hypothetical protein
MSYPEHELLFNAKEYATLRYAIKKSLRENTSFYLPSCLHYQHKSCLADTSSKNEEARKHTARPTPHSRTNVPIMIKQDSSHRIPNQETECSKSEVHSHMRPDQAQIWGDDDHRGSNNRYKSSREESIEYTEDNDLTSRRCASPRVCNYSTKEYPRCHDVECASFVCKEVGNDPTENRSGVEYCQEVESEIRIDDAFRNAEAGNVIEGNIHPHEGKECPEAEQDVLELAKHLKIEQRSSLRREHLCLHDHNWNQQSCQHDECNDSGGPTKANFWLKFVKDCWINDTT